MNTTPKQLDSAPAVLDSSPALLDSSPGENIVHCRYCNKPLLKSKAHKIQWHSTYFQQLGECSYACDECFHSERHQAARDLDLDEEEMN